MHEIRNPSKLKLLWEMVRGQLTGRWMEGEERPEYSIVLIETGVAREHPLVAQAD
jgi:hypothetical protein